MNINTIPININKNPINITVNISPINIKTAPVWKSSILVNPDISSYARYKNMDDRKSVSIINPAAKIREKMPKPGTKKAGNIKNNEIK